MARKGNDTYKNGLLFDGYDYENQSWIVEGKYIRCGHPEEMDCECFGKIHEGQTVLEVQFIQQMDKDNEAMRDYVANGGAAELLGY